jgi:hypothetical protein
VKYCQLLSFEPGGDVTVAVMISIAERAYRESKFDVGAAFGETIALRWPPGYRYSKNVPAAEVESDFIKMLENTDMTIDNDCFVYRVARKPQGKI